MFNVQWSMVNGQWPNRTAVIGREATLAVQEGLPLRRATEQECSMVNGQSLPEFIILNTIFEADFSKAMLQIGTVDVEIFTKFIKGVVTVAKFHVHSRVQHHRVLW